MAAQSGRPPIQRQEGSDSGPDLQQPWKGFERNFEAHGICHLRDQTDVGDAQRVAEAEWSFAAELDRGVHEILWEPLFALAQIHFDELDFLYSFEGQGNPYPG